MEFLIQPSPIRVFSDEEFRRAGLPLTEDLGPADVVLAIKEVPVRLLEPNKTYVFFAHVIKGQPHNMPMLRRLIDLGCTLVDYERVVDEQNRRLIFFGRHAGLAGMIETLWCLGRRLQALGVGTPFAEVRHAFEYPDLSAAEAHLRELGERIRREGLPAALRPLVVGISGYGNVSRGAQEILGWLPVTSVGVEDLAATAAGSGAGLLEVVFKEEHMVRPRDPGGRFELHDYYVHPERYQGCFQQHLESLDVLVNCIYWDERYPRLLEREWARRQFAAGSAPRLKVVGDISCDVEGSVELTSKVTEPDSPCYVHDPVTGAVRDGVEGPGIAIMAVDNLPCELPREASQDFSKVLRGLVPDLATANWAADFESLELPAHLKRAIIVHRGRLTPDYAHLERHLTIHSH